KSDQLSLHLERRSTQVSLTADRSLVTGHVFVRSPGASFWAVTEFAHGALHLRHRGGGLAGHGGELFLRDVADHSCGAERARHPAARPALPALLHDRTALRTHRTGGGVTRPHHAAAAVQRARAPGLSCGRVVALHAGRPLLSVAAA